jgi:hypothetical protein
MLMLGSVFTHPQRGDTIIALTTDTTDLLGATVGVELQGECNLCSIIRAGFKHKKKGLGDFKKLEETLPPGYEFFWDGEFDSTKTSQLALLSGVIPAVLVMISIALKKFWVNRLRFMTRSFIADPTLIHNYFFGAIGRGHSTML